MRASVLPILYQRGNQDAAVICIVESIACLGRPVVVLYIGGVTRMLSVCFEGALGLLAKGRKRSVRIMQS